MRQSKVGNTEIQISPLTVGCWSFGGDAGSYWGEQGQDAATAVVRGALDLGVNTFDTAFAYNDGASEIALGKALAGGLRSRAVIINKIPMKSREALSDYEDAVRASLKRLGTDYVDVLMLHWPPASEELLRANLEALEGVRRLGMARAIGVSNFGAGTLAVARDMGLTVSLNEFAYNLMSRGIEREILPLCRQRGIGIAAYMPLMQGLLTGKYQSIEEIPAPRRRSIQFDSARNPLARHGGPGAEAEVRSLLSALGELTTETRIPAGRLAIAWLMSKAGVTTVIAGCRNPEQLRENATAVETALSPETIARLDEASAPLMDKLGGNCDLWQLGAASRIW